MNNILEYRIVNLEKQLSKNEKYWCHNNIKISGVLNQISDQYLEENILKVCKDLVWISKVVIDLLLKETQPAQ